MLEKWIEFGLRDSPIETHQSRQKASPPVTLMTTKSQELFTFLRPNYTEDRTLLEDGLPEERGPGNHDFPFWRPEPPMVFTMLPYLKRSVLYLFGKHSDLSSSVLRSRDYCSDYSRRLS